LKTLAFDITAAPRAGRLRADDVRLYQRAVVPRRAL